MGQPQPGFSGGAGADLCGGLSQELGKLQREGLLEFHKNHFVLRRKG